MLQFSKGSLINWPRVKGALTHPIKDDTLVIYMEVFMDYADTVIPETGISRRWCIGRSGSETCTLSKSNTKVSVMIQ